MRKPASILFLLVLLFNLVGYRFMLDGLQQQQDHQTTFKIDQSEYSDEDLISVKTVLNLPYYSSSPEFERAYGSMNIDGVEYDYVKRRVYNGTLELLCLPNQEKTKLQAVKNDFLKLSIDNTNSQPNKKSSTILKISLPDYSQQFSLFSIAALNEIVIKHHSKNFNFIYEDFSVLREQPPKA
ncbi:MAG: hypothetical protein ACXWCZ_13205 [Flavisolibacter sp.]